MGYYVSLDGNYHEGDPRPGDVVVPQRPDFTCKWLGDHWSAPTPAPVDNITPLLASRNAKQISDLESRIGLATSTADMQSVMTDLLNLIKGKP